MGDGVTTLVETRDGLKDKIDTIYGLQVYTYIPENTGYPAAIIYPPTFADYSDAVGGGTITVTFVVMLLVQATIDRQQLGLYDLLDRTGPSSVYAAVMADRTLGGLNVDCRVVDAVDPLDRGQMALTNVYQRAITIEAIVG